MEQQGLVIGVNGGMATVKFVRSKACAHCNACLSFGDNEAIVDISNTVGAEVGDTVSITLHSRSLVKASLLMYGIPLVLLLIGALLGSLISDLATAAFGIVLAAGGFLLIRALEPRFERMSEFRPRMIEIISHKEEED